ncbi:MAG: hypothetical protein M5T61_09145 [Acidimicrobiia bacterium]|nr:hypothetical protein [Acidimicrobiia bacterium]
MTAAVTPWWNAMRLRREIVAGSGVIDDVQMSLFNAVQGTAGERPPYADASYYGEITHPSPNLVEFVARVAVRLGGRGRYTAAPALWRLDQAMGGGKSHAMIGLWHLAAHPVEFRATDIGGAAWATASRIIGGQLPADLDNPQVVVLSCDNMTAGRGTRRSTVPRRRSTSASSGGCSVATTRCSSATSRTSLTSRRLPRRSARSDGPC